MGTGPEGRISPVKEVLTVHEETQGGHELFRTYQQQHGNGEKNR